MIARNQLIGLIAGVVLMVAAITGAVLVGSDTTHASPEAVVRSYLTAMYEQGDAARYLDLIDPQALEELETEYGLVRADMEEWLQAFFDDLQQEIAMGASISFEVVSTERQNGRAETVVTIVASHPTHGDEEFTETIGTVERDGRWYLAELRW